MTDLVSVLERLGVGITAIGERRIFGLCPKHAEIKGKADTDPSWSIDRQLHVHHCFSCGYKGTLAGLIADLNDETPAWAAEWLAEHDRVTTFSRVRKLGTAQDPGPSVSGPYRALESLLKGFCAPPDSALAARQLERFAVTHYGVLWDPAEKAWILPIRQENGALLGYQRKKRRVVRNHPPKLRKRETLFGIDLFAEGDRAVLVESPLDVVRLYSEGVTGGLSSYGVIVSDLQLELIVARCNTLVLALDNDDDGRMQTEILLGRLGRRLRVEVLDYAGTTAKDAGEMTRPEIEQALTAAATPWGRKVAQLA